MNGPLLPIPLVYVATLAGRHYATQWTIDRGMGADHLRAYEFLVEIDPAATGAGGGSIRQRSRLYCDGDGHPVRATSDIGGAKTAFEFQRETVNVRLPDGSSSGIPCADAAFLIDGNVPAHLALIVASLWRSGALGSPDGVNIALFGTGQLTTIPCRIAPAGDANADGSRVYRTSQLEEIVLDAQGIMREVRVPHVGYVATLQDTPPPVPDWPDDLSPAGPRLRYVPPVSEAFTLFDVTIAGPIVPIGATLSIPTAPGPHPGVLFVSGSGTHDRHGIAGEIDIGSHELMDALAARGFVGLRFDTRGAGATALGADALDRGIASDIADARACLLDLRQRDDVAGEKLFLIGHSQGGTEILALATEPQTRDLIGGIVLMATMGRDLDELMHDQIVEQGRVLAYTPEQTAQQLAIMREAVDHARAGTAWQTGQVPDPVLAMFRTPTWLREFLLYRAQEMIARVRCPVLVCQGARDFQVSSERDAARLVSVARAAGIDCRYALFPDLDHLFKRTTHSTLAQYHEPRPVDADFIATVSDWLAAQAGAKT